MTLNAPCPNCPFLRAQVAMLRAGRKREIAAALRRGEWFPCHKTVDYEQDDGGRTTHRSRWCAGALATMENEPDPGAAKNQAVRIAQRLGLIDLEALRGRELVFGSLREWVAGGCVPAGRTGAATDTTIVDALAKLQGAPCPNCGQRHGAGSHGCTDGG